MRGRIRFSAQEESIQLRDLSKLAVDREFSLARAEGWKLPRFFGLVENLVVLMESPVDRSVEMLKTFTALKVVKLELWRGFRERVSEDVKIQRLRMFEQKSEYFSKVFCFAVFLAGLRVGLALTSYRGCSD